MKLCIGCLDQGGINNRDAKRNGFARAIMNAQSLCPCGVDSEDQGGWIGKIQGAALVVNARRFVSKAKKLFNFVAVQVL